MTELFLPVSIGVVSIYSSYSNEKAKKHISQTIKLFLLKQDYITFADQQPLWPQVEWQISSSISKDFLESFALKTGTVCPGVLEFILDNCNIPISLSPLIFLSALYCTLSDKGMENNRLKNKRPLIINGPKSKHISW